MIFPTKTQACHIDKDGNEYFGECAEGIDVNRPRWTVYQKYYAGKSWILLFPVKDGLATTAAEFVWSDVESYEYRELGT